MTRRVFATKIVVMPVQQMTIYDRLIHAIRSRGRTESERAICTKIGLSPSYLSSLRDSCLKNPERSIDVDTAVKFARELGISVEQLTGHSDPPSTDRYPGRSEAIVAARAMKLSQRAIDSACDESPEHDPGVVWWFRRMEAEEARFSVPSAPSLGRSSAERFGGRDRRSKL